jgi:D-alanine-D-alanine ligase
MRVAFLYNRAAEDPANFAEDDDPQRSPVVAALQSLGHEVVPIACTLDLRFAQQELLRVAPDVAFNRVESLGGSDAMAIAIPVLLDALQIPYTGCHTEALAAAVSKTAVKQRLLIAGLPTPEWIDAPTQASRVARNSPWRGVPAPEWNANTKTSAAPQPWILKSIYEHASFEINDDAIFRATSIDDVYEPIRHRSDQTRKPFFAERYIDGREFNLSLIGDAPEVLPPAEIDFSAFPAAKPRIVGYGAKWASDSFEFQNTPRRFDFPAADTPLVEELKSLATRCWRLFGLRGYARIDFRVDTDGQPWILEVNTNPCIAPSSGLAAAVEHAGMTYEEGIRQIVEAALSKKTSPSAATYDSQDRSRPFAAQRY